MGKQKLGNQQLIEDYQTNFLYLWSAQNWVGIMIIWVVEFSREGYKIRKFAKNEYSQKNLFYFCELT